jgi:hypothetical protein
MTGHQPDTAPPLGAYGLRLEIPGAESFLSPVRDNWTPWRVVVEVDPEALGAEEEITDAFASAPVSSGGRVRVDRATATTTFVLPEQPAPAALVHPLLAFTAVVAARWRGLLSFHGGAVVVDGGAWGILGDKGRGKSSTLAALSGLGCGILADDVITLENGECLAGPRSVDLREAARRLFPEAQALGVIGDRKRWRVQTAPVEPTVPLRGWVILDWGDEVRLERVAVRDRMPTLAEHFSVRMPPRDLQGMLDCAALPMVRFSRPDDPSGVRSTAADLLRGLATASD